MAEIIVTENVCPDKKDLPADSYPLPKFCKGKNIEVL
jgi:hypothetical protein